MGGTVIAAVIRVVVSRFPTFNAKQYRPFRRYIYGNKLVIRQNRYSLCGNTGRSHQIRQFLISLAIHIFQCRIAVLSNFRNLTVYALNDILYSRIQIFVGLINIGLSIIGIRDGSDICISPRLILYIFGYRIRISEEVPYIVSHRITHIQKNTNPYDEKQEYTGLNKASTEHLAFNKVG